LILGNIVGPIAILAMSRSIYRVAIQTAQSHDAKCTAMTSLAFRATLRILSMTLLTVSTVAASMINFSLGLLVAMLMAPVILVLTYPPSHSLVFGRYRRLLEYTLLAIVSPLGLLAVNFILTNVTPVTVLERLALDYHAAGVWVYPFLCVCYTPTILALLASI
jgi:uncharacterized membrane protein